MLVSAGTASLQGSGSLFLESGKCLVLLRPQLKFPTCPKLLLTPCPYPPHLQPPSQLLASLAFGSLFVTRHEPLKVASPCPQHSSHSLPIAYVQQVQGQGESQNRRCFSYCLVCLTPRHLRTQLGGPGLQLPLRMKKSIPCVTHLSLQDQLLPCGKPEPPCGVLSGRDTSPSSRIPALSDATQRGQRGRFMSSVRVLAQGSGAWGVCQGL